MFASQRRFCLFQIAEGDVCRGLRIPIYMIFPRLFTCPSLSTANFKIGKYDNYSLTSSTVHILYKGWLGLCIICHGTLIKTSAAMVHCPVVSSFCSPHNPEVKGDVTFN